MSARDQDFETIMAGLAQATDIVEGRAAPSTYRVHVPDDVDVKAIRARTGLSQTAFARQFGFSVSAVRDWEQNRRRPEASARILLLVIDREPEAVARALSAA
jgi:putative transcriptional regulator